MALGLALLCVAFATNRAAVVAAGLLGVAIRFGLAFLFTHDSRALIGAVACLVGAVVAVFLRAAR